MSIVNGTVKYDPRPNNNGGVDCVITISGQDFKVYAGAESAVANWRKGQNVTADMDYKIAKSGKPYYQYVGGSVTHETPPQQTNGNAPAQNGSAPQQQKPALDAANPDVIDRIANSAQIYAMCWEAIGERIDVSDDVRASITTSLFINVTRGY